MTTTTRKTVDQRLEEMARDMVGDNKSPNLYFVTDEGAVVTVTANRRIAYAHWRELAGSYPRRECALEDRQYGVICSVEPQDDAPSSRLVVMDDYTDEEQS